MQSRFVDQPALALSEADTILTQLLAERGLPTDDPRTSADMLSVEHAHVLDSFRAGHAIEQANTSSRSDTEQVRQGMLHFRSVFDALLDEGGARPTRRKLRAASRPGVRSRSGAATAESPRRRC